MIKRMRTVALVAVMMAGFMVGASFALADDGMEMASDADNGTAMALAVANIPVAPASGADGKGMFSVGLGASMFREAHGIAAGVATHIGGITIRGSIATDGSFDETAFGIGVAMRF